MISWIQRYFSKHFRLVFVIVLVAIGLPMVVIYSQSSGLGHADRRAREQPFFGHNLANEQDAARIMRDGQFSAQLRGAFQASGPQLQQFALNRAAGLALADQLRLPAPTEAEVSTFIAALPAFQNEQGAFDEQRYAQFGDALKANSGFTTADATRVLRDDTRLDALSRLVGGPGYVLPADVREQLARADAVWSLVVATVSYADFQPEIPATDAVLEKFHAENAFRYEIPARPRVSLVEFPAAEFQPANAPTEDEARAYYQSNPARFPAPADTPASAAAPSLDAPAPATDAFPKVRAQVEAAMKQDAARSLASKAANDFTVALYERKAAANSPELDAFLSLQRRRAVPVAPFTPDAPPADRPWLTAYTDQLGRLGPARFFSDPLQTPDGFVVALWHETLEARQPGLAEVRARVAADYQESERRLRFIAHGREIRGRLEAAVKAGTDFAAAAAAEKLPVRTFTDFTLRQPPQDLPAAAGTAFAHLSAGQISEMSATADQGTLVFVARKTLPDFSDANPRFAELRTQLMQFTAASNEAAILNHLVEAELKKSAPAPTEP